MIIIYSAGSVTLYTVLENAALNSKSGSCTFTVSAGSASMLKFVALPTDEILVEGTVFATQPIVEVYDSTGYNKVTTYATNVNI